MTLEELLQLPHLKLAEHDQLVHLCADDNYWITDFDASTMKPNQYAATQCLYINVLDEYNEYKTITQEEHDQRMEDSANYEETEEALEE